MLKKIILALAVIGVSTPAFADNQTVSFDLSGLAHFDATSPVLAEGDDIITFDSLAAGTYEFLFSISAQNINGLTASLNGQDAVMNQFGKFSFGYLESTGTSPFTLTLKGITGSGTPFYTGELQVVAVPEPETYALMLAGLGLVGFAARRKAQA